MNENSQPLGERLLLLLLNEQGKLVAGRTTDYLLAGAVLADLVFRGRVDIAGPGESVRAGRVLVRSTAPTGDSLLDAALERVCREQGAKPSSVIRPLSKGARRAMLERLTAAGAIRESTRNVLGVFPVRSWLTVDWRLAARARLAVRNGVEHGARPDPDTSMLISLLSAGGVLHKVQPTTDRMTQQQLAQENWVSVATRQALEDSAAVVTEAVTVAAVF